MADLYTNQDGSPTDLAINTKKVQPSSLFGTRQLKFISLYLYDYNLYTDDDNGSYKDPDSLYSKIVRTIEEVAELYYLGAPTLINNDTIVFGIADTTGQWYYSDEGDHDQNELGIDETDDVYPYRYFSSGGSAINDLVDRLYNLFFLSDLYNNGGPDVFGIEDFDLRQLEDTGFGLMPGDYLY